MIVCTGCGFENEDGRDFCISCGTFLEWTGQKVAEEKPARPAPKPAPKPVSSSSPPREQAKPASPTGTARSGSGATSSAASSSPKAAEPAGASATTNSAAAKSPATETPDGAQSEEDRKKADADARARALVTRPTAVTPASATSPARPARPAERSDASRQPAAQRPTAQKPGMAKPRVPPKTPAQMKEKQYKPGDKICGDCSEGNDPARKFCRKCGASLMEAQVAVEPSWWKRVFSKKKKVYKAGERRTRADGTLKDGRPPIWLTIKKVFRVIFVIFIILFTLAMLGPWRGSVMSGARDRWAQVKRIFIAEYEPLHADGIDATSSLPDHPPALAIDGATNFTWQEGAPGDGEGQKLILTFRQQVDIDRIGIRSGASNKQDEFLAQPRPRELHLVFSNGVETDIQLKDTPAFQTFKVKAHAVVRMEITVTSVNTSFRGGHDMGIAEVELFTRK